MFIRLIRAFLVVLTAVAGFCLAGCGSDGATQPVQSTEIPAPASQTASPTTLAPSSAAPKSDFPPLTPADFIAYVPNGKSGEWKPEHSTGLPILRANSTQVTAFIYKGVTCQVALLNGVQATPARVLGMFATLNSPAGKLPRGDFDYTLPAVGGGNVTVGTYHCK